MRQALFTFNFKRAKIAAELLIGSALLFLGVHILNYVYQEPYYEGRIMWKSFYQQENIDTVFLGSSHVYCDIDVYVVDE